MSRLLAELVENVQCWSLRNDDVLKQALRPISSTRVVPAVV
jgi:hypothetical protein